MTTVLLICAALSVALSGLFSGAETGIYCLNRVRLRLRGGRKDRAAARVEKLMNRRDELIITTLVGTTIADYLASVCIAALLLRAAVPDARTELYTTLILSPLIFVFGNAVPKNWFQRSADRLMYVLSLPLVLSRGLVRLTGLLWLLRKLTRIVLRWVDPAGASRRETILPRSQTLRLLREGAAGGGLTAEQGEMIERVMNLSEIRVGRVMIPRPKAAIIDAEITRDDFLRIARMAHFSRMPAFRQDGRHVLGIVNVYDVLADEEARPIAEHIQPAMTLAPTDTVSAALVRMQAARETMAIVVSRSGTCVGILTVKDLVEEIVGDLAAW